MGYRSEVGFAIKGTALAELIEGDSSLTDLVKICLNDADLHKKSDDGNHLFIWDDVKWYPYDEVAAFEKRLNCIDSESYRFIRLGENDDDTETQGGWYDNEFGLGYIRKLEYDA